jgi:hypothetical protein
MMPMDEKRTPIRASTLRAETKRQENQGKTEEKMD